MAGTLNSWNPAVWWLELSGTQVFLFHVCRIRHWLHPAKHWMKTTGCTYLLNIRPNYMPCCVARLFTFRKFVKTRKFRCPAGKILRSSRRNIDGHTSDNRKGPFDSPDLPAFSRCPRPAIGISPSSVTTMHWMPTGCGTCPGFYPDIADAFAFWYKYVELPIDSLHWNWPDQ